MAIKKSVSGNMLEYIIIRPTGGFNKSQIADGVLLGETDIERIKKQLPTYNKIVAKFKDNLLEFGWQGLDYAWERIGHHSDYDKVHKEMVDYITSLEPNLT